VSAPDPAAADVATEGGGPFRAVAAFLDRYRAALERFDADAAAACYRTPLPVVRPDRTSVVEDAATLRAEIAHILDFYRWSGMARLAFDRLAVQGFDPGLDVVSLTWRPMTAAGAEIARIDVTFALRRTADGARIAAVLAHDEERRRAPIVREALDALAVAPPRPAAIGEG
jgi:hypothetical protein